MIGKAWNALALAALFTAGVQSAGAQGTGSLTSKIELEKSTASSDGQPPKKTYVAPDVVVPGDRVRVALTFTNNGAAPAAGLNLVNPIPDGLMFDDTADTAGFGVSTDGGKTFGALAALTVPVGGAAPRPATAADVTHVRWLWPDAIAPGQSRSVAFFGRVR
ncbi:MULTISPECIES: hypothetical protein [unclassified Sphingopyxis]|uniref:hypothetical protein n=1 Tax=unclassified Sphingopyxis TaxID=2614943 RepID=UPI00286086F0|nr:MULTISPECIES: hypothetical protein [unclassified Sphingopyxis]MDR7060189.1 putative repeat protein (TIGR01451 family) [Sphingopyxis sp. BE235]MDR7180298.1 putative repeat protein (TIGR01451 family) [Sphingopyxis sp. BE249]